MFVFRKRRSGADGVGLMYTLLLQSETLQWSAQGDSKSNWQKTHLETVFAFAQATHWEWGTSEGLFSCKCLEGTWHNILLLVVSPRRSESGSSQSVWSDSNPVNPAPSPHLEEGNKKGEKGEGAIEWKKVQEQAEGHRQDGSNSYANRFPFEMFIFPTQCRSTKLGYGLVNATVG